MAKKRIMIVEDEGVTAMSIKKCMQDMGYTVTPIMISGENAVENAEKARPDMVLMDIVLKGEMDGIEAADRIRSRFDIPIIYITAYLDETMMKRMKITEPLGYIAKPFDKRELQVIVEIAFYKHDMEQRLKEHTEELEMKVKERTSELKSTIEHLENTKNKLKSRAMELSETNTALKVLLNQRLKDKAEYENNMLSNIQHLVMPYIEQLKKNSVISDELTYLNIIESNLKDILSPFSARLSFQYLKFTPREIMVSQLIKDGKQDKDIMGILNISPDTVKAYRKNIRKKLGIKNQKINLRTKLLSLSE